MQGAQLKRLIPLAVAVGMIAWSSKLDGVKFIPIYEALTIKAQKNSPAYVAFEELIETRKPSSEFEAIAKKKSVQLNEAKSSAPLFSQKVVLAEMVLKKTPEPIPASNAEATSGRLMASESSTDSQWIEQLPRKEQARLREAQERSEVLDQSWNEPSFSEKAKEVLEKSGVLVGTTIRTPAASTVSGSKVYVAATDNSGHTRTEPSRPQVVIPGQPAGPGEDGVSRVLSEKTLLDDQVHSGNRRIVGPIEITGGLAVTNEHHIEIRRNDEGILKELGRVDLVQGTYNIDVEETTGSVVAHLVDKDGKTLGEGSFRLNRVATNNSNYLQGPKLRIEPHPDFSGAVASIYDSKANTTAPKETRVTFVKGISDMAVKKDGLVSMDNVTKGSSTVMRAAAPKYLQTSQIIVSGQEFKASLYPTSMIAALQDIIAQQRAQSFDGEPSVIWGRVALDGKPLSGIDVSDETDPSLQPIYFNSFMIPDPSLKTTGENGLFAFVSVSEGFHSLLATRSDAILGYSNVVVEENAVAQGDIDGTIKIESVPLKVFDAFTGEPQNASITMQSLPEEVSVENGLKTLSLPHLNRLGLMRVHPEGSDYVAARYLYNDSEEYIHVPLVKFTWLSAIKNFLRIDDSPSGAIVVGFVPDEDFEVYIAGYDNFNPRNIVYIDMQGRILQNRKGMGGGGFILYNVPEDTHEIVVIGSKSQKIYSRVIPVDANSLSVLTFRE